MKVKELIEILKACHPDSTMEVKIEHTPNMWTQHRIIGVNMDFEEHGTAAPIVCELDPEPCASGWMSES